MRKHLYSSPILLIALSACLDQAPADKATGTGAMLSMDYFGGSDVVGFHFEIERVACDAADAFSPLSIEANVDLVDGIFPGQIELVEQVYDETSRHLGADLFQTLPAGCYDVTAAPASAVDGDDWTPSADCSVANAEGAEVLDGATTEVTLISQCVGDENGALDTLVTLNHPPVVSIDFPTEDRNGDGIANGDDGKFNYECEPVEVCATIYDEDDDPIEIDWSVTPASGVFSFTEGDLEVIGFENGHRVWEQCVEVVTQLTDSYDVTFTAWDLGYESGSLVRIESLVAPETSHDDLEFPIHTNWAEEPLCFDGSGNLVPAEGVDIHREAGCSYVDAEDYYCSGAYAVDPDVARFLCDGTNLIEERLYPDCDGGEINCDGIDNDGDGTTDEDSSYGTQSIWTYSGGGSHGAGTLTTSSASYNSLTERLTFRSTLQKLAGKTPNGFTMAMNNGPNPKGHAELALMYMDCNAGSPIITVYAYNGLNMLTSYYDGSSSSGTQAPDRIVSSLLDSSFVNSASCTDDGSNVTFAFDIDVSGINSHSPLYTASWAWTGMEFGNLMGIWYHPFANATFTYSGGWLNNLNVPYQGWIDTSNDPATSTPVCE